MPRKKIEEEQVENGAPAAESGELTADPSVQAEESSVVSDILDTVSTAVSNVVEAVADGASSLVSAVAGSGDPEPVKRGKRAEKVGIVTSDKMMKTVVVRVDRLVKHPTYRKYVKKRKKFMAHDEMEAKIGDKVKIVETRPMSARKRWRVVEIIHRAEN